MASLFETIATNKVSGHLQAVSDNGKAAIYRSDDTLYLYYFDGSSITTQNYTFSKTMDSPDQFYSDENSFHHTLVKVIDEKVIVYMVDSPFLYKVEFPDYRQKKTEYQET